LKIEATAHFSGLSPLSLRGARFLAYASEQAPQSREGYEIATPRQVGARNDNSLLSLRGWQSQPKQSHGGDRGLPRFARNDKKRGNE